ncbi:MAG TPA: thioredoxin [Prolixibacteraceae bacterium]|nr:thioredoxin [Prolixibacteraceae bacterium]HPS12561.1 thioredoxin [Prolixibacteraceae bacterium]
MVIEVNDANFDEVVLQSGVPALVDFWAEWCGPCRMVSPLIDQLSEEYDGKALLTKMDVDSNPAITSRYGIRNIPTILFFKGGEIADKQVGAVPKTVIAQKIDALL